MEPVWQHARLKLQTQPLQSRGERLKLIQHGDVLQRDGSLRQTCETEPPELRVTQRQVPSGTPAQESPLSPVPRCPYRQSAQAAHVSPVSHMPLPHTGPHEAQPANPPNVPHVHEELQVRLRVSVPPQAGVHVRDSVSTAPAMHSPSSTQAMGPHWQSAPQWRSWRPQRPQVVPMSTSPGLHTPEPMHAPSSTHAPPEQICRCVPHIPQSRDRGVEPSTQSHVSGAVQVAHTPPVQRSTPAPHELEHSRSALEPTLASPSSQSTAASTPSPSASVPVETHTPARQTSVPVQGGVHGEGELASTSGGLAASTRPPS